MAVMGRETAVEILNEYNSMEDYEPIPIPDDDEELIKAANGIGEAAHQLFEGGNREAQVQAIIWLYDSALPEERKDLPRKSSGGFSEGDLREPEKFEVNEVNAVQLVSKENLPAPRHIESDPDPMPRDLSKVTDRDIRKLSGEYNAYLARTNYLLGIEQSDLMNAEHLLEAERARVLREMDTMDADGKKQKLAKVIEAEILADSEVVRLTGYVNQHAQRVVVLKSLKEIYSGNVDRLSREWTMRQNEWEKSR